MIKDNFLNSKQQSSSPENNFSSQNQPEEEGEVLQTKLKIDLPNNASLKGYNFGDHPQTIEALRSGLLNLGSCNDILHKSAITREKEI